MTILAFDDKDMSTAVNMNFTIIHRAFACSMMKYRTDDVIWFCKWPISVHVFVYICLLNNTEQANVFFSELMATKFEQGTDR